MEMKTPEKGRIAKTYMPTFNNLNPDLFAANLIKLF